MQYSDYVQKMAAEEAFSANYDQRVLGMAPPPYKQILQGVAAALAGSLNPTSLVQYAGQGSTNQKITTSGFGACTAASTDTPTLTALLTSQALDSYLWPIGYGPADPLGGKMRQMDTSPPGSTAHNNLVLGHVEARVGAASHVAGFEVGPGLRIAPYGKRIATNPNDSTQSKVAPGAVDSVVSRPLIELSLGRGIFIDKTVAGGADGAGQTAPDPAWGDIPAVKPDGSMVNADESPYSGPFGWPGLDSASVAAAHSWLIGGARSGSTGGFLSPNIGQRDYASIITTTRTGPSGLMFGSAQGKTDGNQLMVAVDGTSITVDPDTGLLTVGSGATNGAGSAYSPGLAIEFTRAADADAPVSALTPTVQAGTALGIGAYKVYQSYLDANGAETKLSPVATFTTTSGSQQAQYAVPSSPGAQTITGINLYRTKVDGTTTYFVTSIAVSAGVYSGGNYTDTTADSALGAAYVQKTLIQAHLAYSDSARTIPANGLTRDAGFDKKGLAINLAGSTATLGGVPSFLNNSGLSIALADGAGANNGLGIVRHTTIGGTDDSGLLIDTFGVGIKLHKAGSTQDSGLTIDANGLKANPDGSTIGINSSNELYVIGGSSTPCPLYLHCAPVAQANYGVLNMGPGAWSGGTGDWKSDTLLADAAFFAPGRYIAANVPLKFQGTMFEVSSPDKDGYSGNPYRLDIKYSGNSGAGSVPLSTMYQASYGQVQHWGPFEVRQPPRPDSSPLGSLSAFYTEGDVFFNGTSPPSVSGHTGTFTCLVPVEMGSSPVVNLPGATFTLSSASFTNPVSMPTGSTINGSAPLADATTTKGDLLVRNATVLDRLGVGTDGQTLVADSTQTLGVKWGTPTAGSGGSGFNSSGQLQVYPTSNTGNLLSLTPSGLSSPTFNISYGSGTTTATVGNASNGGDLVVHGSESILPINTLSDALLINAPAGFAASLLNLKVNGQDRMSVNQNGVISATGLSLNGSAVYPFGATQTTAPSAGTADALPALPAGYVAATLSDGTPVWLAYYPRTVAVASASSSPGIFSPGVASPGHV